MKIFIIATDWDKEIILQNIYRSGAERVYLIAPLIEKETEELSQRTLNSARYIQNKLEKLTDIKLIEVSYVNPIVAFKSISDIIKSEKSNDITINISSGNKIIASTLLIVAFLYRVKAQYSIPKRYNSYFDENTPWREGINKIINIPLLPLHLDFSKKEQEFILWISNRDTIEIKDFLKEFKYSNENKARASFHYYIDKFESLGLINIKNIDGKKIASVNETGRIISEFIK